MPNRPTVMIVDDVPMMCMMLENSISSSYAVACVNSGEACLAACAEARPDLILLDVEMPRMDGYETCRRIKAELDNPPPVIFVSSHDRIEDRLKGYDAGGDDYVLKPVAPHELLTKIALRFKAVEDQLQLREIADYAGSTAMTAMSSMGEMGVLLLALQRFNSCSSLAALAAETLTALREFSLDGLVALSTPRDSVTLSTQGTVSPMEMSIIGQVAAMGRIVEYRSRMSVSYQYAKLLISNAPPEKDERRGRLRDHLAVLAESADLRARAIHRDQVVEQVALRAVAALERIDEQQRRVQVGCNLALQDMQLQFERAYVSLSLSETQENHLSEIAGLSTERIGQALMAGTDLQQQLTSVVGELNSVIASGRPGSPENRP